MLGGSTNGNSNKDTDFTNVNGIIILDLQSVITYGTNGNLIEREGKTNYIKNFFKGLNKLTNDNTKKVYILSDGLSINQLDNLVSFSDSDKRTITDMFENNVNYFIFSDRSAKKNALIKILENYTSKTVINLDKILYITRLESENKTNEKKMYESYVKDNDSTKQLSGNFETHVVDTPKNIPINYNIFNMFTTFKSLKEMIYNPAYLSPFTIAPQHYKSLMRHIDGSGDLLKGVNGDGDGDGDAFKQAFEQLLL